MLGGGGAIGDRDRERLTERLSEREYDRRWRRDESRSLLRFLDPIFFNIRISSNKNVNTIDEHTTQLYFYTQCQRYGKIKVRQRE